MINVSKSVLMLAGAALFAGTFATDASAQRRNRNNQAAPAEPARPQVSPAFSAAFQPVNAAINASDLATADAGLPALRAAATTPYELFVVAQTDFRIATAQNNAARQLTALDAMADSNGAPAADAPRVFMAAGQMAYNARDYAKAASRFERAIALGSTADNLNILHLDALLRANQMDQGLAIARQQIAAAQSTGRPAGEQVYSLTARALQAAGRTPELIEFLTARARHYPSAPNLRSLGIIFLQNQPDNRGVTLDVMRVLLEANALDERRYYVEYAGAAVEEGLPNEAIAVANAARAAGRTQPNDVTFNEVLQSQNAKLAEDRASLAGSARRAREVPEARLATLTGDAYLTYGQFPQALEMYALAMTKNNADANLLNTRIGITRFRSGDMAAARQAFEAVQGPRATIAAMWLGLMDQRAAAAAAPPAQPAAPAPTAPPAG
jgi:tetratricopeptide (TPR) repeat protein